MSLSFIAKQSVQGIVDGGRQGGGKRSEASRKGWPQRRVLYLMYGQGMPPMSWP